MTATVFRIAEPFGETFRKRTRWCGNVLLLEATKTVLLDIAALTELDFPEAQRESPTVERKAVRSLGL